MVFPGKWHDRLAVGGKHLCYLAINRDAGCVGRHHRLVNADDETRSSNKIKIIGGKLEHQYLIYSIDPVLYSFKH